MSSAALEASVRRALVGALVYIAPAEVGAAASASMVLVEPQDAAFEAAVFRDSVEREPL